MSVRAQDRRVVLDEIADGILAEREATEQRQRERAETEQRNAAGDAEKIERRKKDASEYLVQIAEIERATRVLGAAIGKARRIAPLIGLNVTALDVRISNFLSVVLGTLGNPSRYGEIELNPPTTKPAASLVEAERRMAGDINETTKENLT